MIVLGRIEWAEIRVRFRDKPSGLGIIGVIDSANVYLTWHKLPPIALAAVIPIVSAAYNPT
jgi:hypothetical protein